VTIERALQAAKDSNKPILLGGVDITKAPPPVAEKSLQELRDEIENEQSARLVAEAEQKAAAAERLAGRAAEWATGGKLSGDARVVEFARLTSLENEEKQAAAFAEAETTPLTRGEIDTSVLVEKPKFPSDVMNGTFFYDHFVEPACRNSAKHPELVFLSTAVTLMNYLDRRVTITGEDTNLVQFLGLICPPGDYGKSSSCELAFDYCTALGTMTRNAAMRQDKTLCCSAGSSEGFARKMRDAHTTHGILYYDELAKAVSKAGIEHSSLGADLLIMRERGLFENAISNPKHSYCFEAGSYSFSLLFCTTVQAFATNWSKMVGTSTGLDDRTLFFVLEVNKEFCGKKTRKKAFDFKNPTMDADKKLIDEAIKQHNFQYAHPEFLDAVSGQHKGGLRSYNRISEFSLFFAVALGLKEVTDDCIVRGAKITEYFRLSRLYEEAPEASNDAARLAQVICRELHRNGGHMAYRNLVRDLHGEREGAAWDDAIQFLGQGENDGIGHIVRIVFWYETVNGGKSKRVGLKRLDD
jgi:hypothetical protein